MPLNLAKLYRAKELADLLETIRPEDSCWSWPYARSKSGYGQLQFMGKNRTVQSFGVSGATICDVVARRTWRHI